MTLLENLEILDKTQAVDEEFSLLENESIDDIEIDEMDMPKPKRPKRWTSKAQYERYQQQLKRYMRSPTHIRRSVKFRTQGGYVRLRKMLVKAHNWRANRRRFIRNLQKRKIGILPKQPMRENHILMANPDEHRKIIASVIGVQLID